MNSVISLAQLQELFSAVANLSPDLRKNENEVFLKQLIIESQTRTSNERIEMENMVEQKEELLIVADVLTQICENLKLYVNYESGGSGSNNSKRLGTVSLSKDSKGNG